MNRSIFVDTSYILALFNRRDSFHDIAAAWATRLAARKFLTTHAVILEIGNAFSRAALRSAGIAILAQMKQDARMTILPHSETCHEQAIELYASRRDKEWGLTDCVSFVVMRQHGLTEALTTDEHFQQAGFRALLLETGGRN